MNFLAPYINQHFMFDYTKDGMFVHVGSYVRGWYVGQLPKEQRPHLAQSIFGIFGIAYDGVWVLPGHYNKGIYDAEKEIEIELLKKQINELQKAGEATSRLFQNLLEKLEKLEKSSLTPEEKKFLTEMYKIIKEDLKAGYRPPDIYH